MTFTAYIQRQKSLIRSRRDEEVVRIYRREEIIPQGDTDSLFDELSSLAGLNTAERQRYSRIFTRA